MNDLTVVEKIAQWQRLKELVLDSVSSPITKRVYSMALDEFLAWFRQEHRPGGFCKATVSAWRASLKVRGLGSSSIIIRMSAIRKLAAEAVDNGLMAPDLAAGIARVKSAKSVGIRTGNWLSIRKAQNFLKRAGYQNFERAAQPRHPCCSSGLRPASVRSGCAHVRSHPAARWPLVHC
jgi:site-specific recombinase XerC